MLSDGNFQTPKQPKKKGKTMRIMIALLFSVVLAISPVISSAIAGSPTSIEFFSGAWTGMWVSDKAHGDNAPMRAIIKVDADSNTVIITLFQVPTPPAPAYSSMSMGKFDGVKVFIDAASSGIASGGTKMTFWLENPLVMKGTYKNQYDEGKFEFRRFSRIGA